MGPAAEAQTPSWAKKGVVWEFKGEEGNSEVDEKEQTFDKKKKKNSCWITQKQWDTDRSLTNRLC